jgi:hypothetical protein
MAVKLGITVNETTADRWDNRTVLVGGSVSAEDEAILFLVFKDTTNGKKYKLQVTNGAVEVVEVV